MALCSDCGKRDAVARGFCNTCYARARRRGFAPLPTESERFWAKVEKAATCWLWRAAKTPPGYGVFRLAGNGRLVLAHRYAYEQIVGPIPEGLELDHVECDNPTCVNPAHVEAVTHKQNVGRAVTTHPVTGKWMRRPK